MRTVRPGFAVLLALFAMILFGALALTMVFAAGAETRASASALGMSRSISAAEGGVWMVISTFDWESALSYLPGQSARLELPFGGAATSVRVVRIDSTCFFVQGETGAGPNSGGNPRFIRRVGVTIEVRRDSLGLVRAFRVPNRAWTELF